MPDNKLTDIKELLEYKAKVGCQNCDIIGKGCCSTCVNSLIKSFIGLFDRLQADCENYKQVAENQQSVTMDRGFEIKRLTEKVNRLQTENENYSKNNGQMTKDIYSLQKEIERLRGIILSFMQEITDWGNKNNIDTTNFSTIPILEKEKHSIIKQYEQEIDILQGAVDTGNETCKQCEQKHKAEIERLQEMLQDLYTAVPIGNNKKYANELQKLKAKAVKEFAERLKEVQFTVHYCESFYNVVDIDDIDKLLKELASETVD